MNAEVIENTYILLPNQEHKNFTISKDILKKGDKVEGEPKYITGKRRGEAFTYRLFRTNDGKLIYLNKVKMENESGADGKATVINFAHAEYYSSLKIALGLAGGIAGFLYAKHAGKNKLWFTLGGVVAGYGTAWIIDRKPHVATVKKV